ncbi:hypothetical protein Hypma_013760 [Hypsizygus marmoreus]|uniref:Uncharacterized protein n=1 Tax=Hypsizygus marmoreus TaxID=39966 RepID=A0A369KFT9_HYPMA|nr:hypothetical protein Hypma_013760 [Hypsizygus marmoreus]
MSNWLPSQSSRYASRKPIPGHRLPSFLDDSYIFHDKSYYAERKRITNCKSSKKYYRKNIDLEREKARIRMWRKCNPGAITPQSSTSAIDGNVSSSDDDEHHMVTNSQECSSASESEELVIGPAESDTPEAIACNTLAPIPPSPSVSKPPKYQLKQIDQASRDIAEAILLEDLEALKDFLEEAAVEDYSWRIYVPMQPFQTCT